MTSNKKLVKKIIKFFDSTFSTYSFERMVDMNEDCGYNKDEWTKFYKHNIQCINKSSEETLIFLYLLIKNIKKKVLRQCDEESFVEFNTYTFYFNKAKQIVFMNPR